MDQSKKCDGFSDCILINFGDMSDERDCGTYQKNLSIQEFEMCCVVNTTKLLFLKANLKYGNIE